MLTAQPSVHCSLSFRQPPSSSIQDLQPVLAASRKAHPLSDAVRKQAWMHMPTRNESSEGRTYNAFLFQSWEPCEPMCASWLGGSRNPSTSDASMDPPAWRQSFRTSQATNMAVRRSILVSSSSDDACLSMHSRCRFLLSTHIRDNQSSLSLFAWCTCPSHAQHGDSHLR